MHLVRALVFIPFGPFLLFFIFSSRRAMALSWARGSSDACVFGAVSGPKVSRSHV